MLKFDDSGCFDLKHCELGDLRDYYAGRILEKLLEDGGSGLRSELFEAMRVAIQWSEIREAKRKQNGT